eukprot:1145603-Pelagomonas_calceolata.AAC.4
MHLAPPTAAYAATWIASTALSSDAHTQQAKECFQTLPSVSSVKTSAKVNMAHSVLPRALAVEKSSKNTVPWQGIEVPKNVYRNVPDWAFPDGIGPSARHQSRPGVVFVRPI